MIQDDVLPCVRIMYQTPLEAAAEPLFREVGGQDVYLDRKQANGEDDTDGKESEESGLGCIAAADDVLESCAVLFQTVQHKTCNSQWAA